MTDRAWGNAPQGESIVTTAHGSVIGAAIIGANLVRALFASMRDIVGDHAGADEEVPGRAREEALCERRARATTLGAHGSMRTTVAA